MSPADEPVLVVTTHPEEGAEAFARSLVERRLAACVQVLPGVRSSYRWEGRVETEPELRLDIKTTRAAAARLRDALPELHPYDVPELIVLPIVDGLPAYLDWVRTETTPTD
ncbi:MAG: divalent-cation tolerance protein CutA [Acidobacteriota bacterium]